MLGLNLKMQRAGEFQNGSAEGLAHNQELQNTISPTSIKIPGSRQVLLSGTTDIAHGTQTPSTAGAQSQTSEVPSAQV